MTIVLEVTDSCCNKDKKYPKHGDGPSQQPLPLPDHGHAPLHDNPLPYQAEGGGGHWEWEKISPDVSKPGNAKMYNLIFAEI